MYLLKKNNSKADYREHNINFNEWQYSFNTQVEWGFNGLAIRPFVISIHGLKAL